MAAALFFWAVLGALLGAFAKLVLWDEGPQGWLGSMLSSLAGAFAGGYVRGTLGASDGFDLGSMGLVIVGAALLLSFYKLFAERRGAATTVPANRRAA